MKNLFKNNSLKTVSILLVLIVAMFVFKADINTAKDANLADLSQTLELIPITNSETTPAITQVLELEPIKQIKPAITQVLKLEPATKSLPTPTETPWDQQIHHEGMPFGGLITGRVECTCEPPKYMIFLWDFTSNGLITLLVENPGHSRLWETYTLNVGQYALGTYDPQDICKINVGTDCLDYPTTGLINHGPGVGSSGAFSL
jgi:hypothetical protein